MALPSDLGDLAKLRVLYADCCCGLTELPGVMNGFTSLERLQIHGGGGGILAGSHVVALSHQILHNNGLPRVAKTLQRWRGVFPLGLLYPG